MHYWGHTRRRAKLGDLFTYLMPDGKYRFMRYVRNDVPVFSDANLLYFYVQEFNSPNEPPRDTFTPPRLLIPPTMTNNLGWVHGFFKFVAHWPLQPGEVFPRHCFRYWSAKGINYVDEHETPVHEPFEPLGRWALTSYSAIDLRLSDALGLPHAYYEAKARGEIS
jgi:hypothetical protein